MTIYDLPPWLASFFVFLFGAIFGSFLNVCVHRLPMQSGLWASLKGLTHPPSRCPRCMTPIEKGDNLPIVGWLRLGGRCRACRTKIPVRYPGVELFNGLLLVAVYWMDVPSARFAHLYDAPLISPFGPTSRESWFSDEVLVHLRFAFHALLCEILLVASLIDYDLQVIPKTVTDPAIPLGIAGMAIGGMYLLPITVDVPPYVGDMQSLYERRGSSFDVVPPWIVEHPHIHGLLCGIAGALAGALPVLGVRWIGGAALKQEAVGLGDVFLMAAAGAFLGWQPVLVALVLSLVFALVTVAVTSLLGALKVTSGTLIPYGPFLSAGCVATLFGWPWIWPRTIRLFDEMVRSWPITVALIAAFAVALGLSLLLVQLVKRLFGIAPMAPPPEGVWTAADQNQYLAGERPGPQTGLWKHAGWPGDAAGRGQSQQRTWQGERGPL